jgi:hypothetical protein
MFNQQMRTERSYKMESAYLLFRLKERAAKSLPYLCTEITADELFKVPPL